jgi:hypothetical protein
MNAQNLATNAQHTRPRGVGRNVPTLDEIHRRALEIHIERGGRGCDLDNYLDEWLQAERELQGKYNKSNGGAERQMRWVSPQSRLPSCFRSLLRHCAGKNESSKRSGPARLLPLTHSEENNMLKINFSETPVEERWIYAW